jgi:hypothetical protein
MERNLMDHDQAVKSQVCEKYLLGELPPELRNAYEEHYFSCAECAMQLRRAAELIGASQQILARTPAIGAKVHAAPKRGGWFKWLQPAPGGWFRWFKPWVAVPTFAALLLLLGYQSFVIVPKAKEQAASGATQILFNSYPLRGVNTAGEDGRTLSIRPGEAFLLNFDFVPTRSFDSYIAQLQDGEGHTLLQLKIAGGNANREAHLPIPARMLHPGKYILAFYGDPGASGKLRSQNDAGRLPFTVEFRP